MDGIHHLRVLIANQRADRLELLADVVNVDADHATLKAAGVDIDDEVSRWGGPVPPMFWVRDPDGNSLIIVQPSE